MDKWESCLGLLCDVKAVVLWLLRSICRGNNIGPDSEKERQVI
jgi:hypothetical protein